MPHLRALAGWFAIRLSFSGQWSHAWRALRHANERLYFAGQSDAYTTQSANGCQKLPNAGAPNSLYFNMVRFIGLPLPGAQLALTLAGDVWACLMFFRFGFALINLEKAVERR